MPIVNFNDDFFKFIFFDQYLSDIGSTPYKVCKTFTKYLTTNAINNWFTTYFENTEEKLKEDSINPDTIFKITDDTPYLLVGGWVGHPGHAINIYIKKNGNAYDIYIINSGAGVNNHGDPNEHGNIPIIIEYKKITRDKVSNIFLLNKFFQNIYRGSLVNEFYSINEGIKLYNQANPSEPRLIEIWDNKLNGYCKVDLYLNRKDDPIVYYEHIFEILGSSFIQYKFDKPQISSTCTFFSSYYFIKYFIYPDNLEDFNNFIKSIQSDLIDQFYDTLTNYSTLSIPDRLNIPNVCNMLIKDYSNVNTEKIIQIKNIMMSLYNNFENTFIGEYIQKNKIRISNYYLKAKFDTFNKLYMKCYENLERNIVIFKDLHEFVTFEGDHSTHVLIQRFNLLKTRLIYKIYNKKDSITKINFKFEFCKRREYINDVIVYNTSEEINIDDNIKKLYFHILLTIFNIDDIYKTYNNPSISITNVSNKISFKPYEIGDNDFKTYFQLMLEISIVKIPEILELNNFVDKIITYRGLFNIYFFIHLLGDIINQEKISLNNSGRKDLNGKTDFRILGSEYPKPAKEFLYTFIKHNNKTGLGYNIYFNNERRVIEKYPNISYPIVGFNNFDHIINAINSNNFIEIKKINNQILSTVTNYENKEESYPQKRYDDEGIYITINNREELDKYKLKVFSNRPKYLSGKIINYMINKRYYLKTNRNELNRNSTYYKYVDNNLYDTFYKHSVDKIDINKLIKAKNVLNEEMYEDLLVLFYIKRHDEWKKLDDLIKNEIISTLNKESSLKLYLKGNHNKIIKDWITSINSYGSMGALYGLPKFILTNDIVENESEFINNIIAVILEVSTPDLEFNDKSLHKDGYTIININDNEILVAEMNPHKVYQHNQSKKYYYNYYDKLIEIEFSEGKICKYNDNEYELINIDGELEYIRELPPKHRIIIKKINNICEYHIWHSNDHTLIELDLYNIQFKLSSNKNIIIINKEEYNLITDYTYLNGLYILNMNNGFYITKDDKKYIFLLMQNNYILNKSREYEKIGYYLSYINTVDYDINKLSSLKFKNHHLIELSYNELIINDTSSSNILALFVSLIFSKNNIGINLIYRFFKNISNNIKEDNYFSIIKCFHLDTPYRFIYDADSDPERVNVDLDPERDNFLNYSSVKFKSGLIYNDYKYLNQYDISELKNMDEYKYINELSNKINSLKNKKLEKYKTNKYLREYLETFRNNCTKCVEPTDITELKSTTNLDILSKDIILNLINITPSLTACISDLYHNNFYLLYEYLIKLKFKKIYDKLISLDKDDLDCTNILEIIESLDPFIIYQPNKRTIEEICFELTTGLFLRQEQITKFNEIKQDLTSDINNKAYEILMGKGKTSTITPLIILYNYFQNKEILNFNIILPSHLVNQSYNIMLKYSQILINYSINNECNYDSLTKKYQLNILSESNIKEIILNSIKDSELKDISKNKLFIFDEIDSLIDPLKSDLNIPDNNVLDHPLKKKLNEIGIKIVKILLGQEGRVNNDSDEIKIKNNKDDIIYTFTLNDKNLSKMIEIKINKTIKIIESLTFKKDYGFGEFNFKKDNNSSKDDKKHFFTSIPYNAINSPLNESEFTDYELCLFLTIKTYFQNSLRPEDIESIFLTAASDYTYNIDIFKLKYEPLFVIIKELVFKEAIELIGTSQFKKICREISDSSKEHTSKNILLEYYLNYIIFPKYFKIYQNQSNISTIDLFNYKLSSKKISFSGTVNFQKPSEVIDGILEKNESKKEITKIKSNIISNIVEDDSSKGSIMSSILGITTKVPVNNYYDEKLDNETIEKALIDFLNKNLKNYTCIIDAGGLLLKISVEEMVEKINTIKIGLNYILYISNDNVRMCYNVREKKHSVYNDETYSNVFMYYDHKHCVGIDFKQPNNMHGLVTINKEDTLTRISQGIFRLRKINKGHTIDFYLPNKIKPEKDNFIYDYLNGIEVKYKENTLKYMQLQCIKFILRNLINLSTSYIDRLYYDLVKYEDKYINYNEFIKILIEKYNLDVNPTKFKIIIFDDLVTKIAQNVNKNINKEIDQNINLKENINEKRRYSYNIEYYYPYENIEPYNAVSILSFEYNGSKSTELLKINNIQINLSTTYCETLFPTSTTFYSSYSDQQPLYGFLDANNYSLKSRIYYMWDKKQNNLFVIYEIDYYHILDEIKVRKTPYYQASELIIYDIYGSIILEQKPEKLVPKNILNLLNTIFFKKQVSIIDLYQTLYELSNDDNIYIKLNLYSLMFDINVNYDIIALKYMKYLTYYNIEDWCKLFNIPYTEQNTIMFSKLINLYINKYKKPILLLHKNIPIYTYNFDTNEYDYLFRIINDIPIPQDTKETQTQLQLWKKSVLNKLCIIGDNYLNLIDTIKEDNVCNDINILLRDIKKLFDLIYINIHNIKRSLFDKFLVFDNSTYEKKVIEQILSNMLYNGIDCVDLLDRSSFIPKPLSDKHKELCEENNKNLLKLNERLSKNIKINYDEIDKINTILKMIIKILPAHKYLKDNCEYIQEELDLIYSNL